MSWTWTSSKKYTLFIQIVPRNSTHLCKWRKRLEPAADIVYLKYIFYYWKWNIYLFHKTLTLFIKVSWPTLSIHEYIVINKNGASVMKHAGKKEIFWTKVKVHKNDLGSNYIILL